MREARTKFSPEIAYLLLAFAISWIIWLPLVLSVDGIHVFHYSIDPSWIALGTIGPLVASLAISKRNTGHWLTSRFFPIFRPIPMLGLLIAPALLILSIDLGPYFLSTVAGSRHPHCSDFAPLLLLWPGVLGGPLGEEFGWRGFLLPRLMDRFGPTRATLLLSVIWIAWHLPLFLVHTWSSAPLWFFSILMICVSFIMTLGYNLTGGSILAAILAHFTFNCTAEIFVNLLSGAQVRTSSDPFHVVPAVLFLTALVLVLITCGRLGLPEPSTPVPSVPPAAAALE